MKVFKRSLFPTAALLTLGMVGLWLAPAAGEAAVLSYTATLDGASESPANGSPGTGFVQVDIDDVAHTMHVLATFEGLTGTVTAAHIHGPTTVAGVGTAGVATTTPTFAGFPSGVTAGFYDNTLDLTLAGSYNPAFVTANGGTPATAETALAAAIAAGKAYFNIHSTVFPGGEIRGFLTATATPTDQTAWGQLKALYR